MKILGVNYQAVIRSAISGDQAMEVDCRGEYEALIVVGMLANQVDPARGTVKTCVGSKAHAESFT